MAFRTLTVAALAAASVIMAASCSADPTLTQYQSTRVQISGNKTIFEAGEKSCLVGPIKVYDPKNGNVILSIADGRSVPDGCTEKK